MASESISLFSIARNKLQSVVGGNVKDGASLHRWVLLKNSIIRSHCPPTAVAVADKVDEVNVHRPDEEPGHDQVELDAFMFPDPDALHQDTGAGNSEDQWLDSLLENLGDDEDGEETNSIISVAPAFEDDEPLSPLSSPMSSSDDLAYQTSFYYASDSIAIPYPIPYPPLHPPLMPDDWLELDSSANVLPPSPPLYHDPLPYFDADELEDLPVPDAIEDTSDDESDAPSTPFSNSTSSLSPTDSPRDRTRTRSHPQVYIDSEDSYFYPFELDPLPFPDNTVSHPPRAFHRPHYHEC